MYFMSHLEICLEKYFNNVKVISTCTDLSHDGFDSYGPESNIYELIVLFYKNKKLYTQRFTREYWYVGEDTQQYFPITGEIELSNQINEKGYYMKGELDNIKSMLEKKFCTDLVDYISTKFVKKVYEASSLEIENNYDDLENSEKILELSKYFSLYFKTK